MKPIYEARADAARIEGNAIGGGKSSENSRATSPIRTDEAVASLASISSNIGRRNLGDYQRGILALRMKPIYEARALARQQGEQGGVLLSPNSDEATPIRTDESIASLANLGKDTIRKIEQIDATAAPEVKALAAAGVSCGFRKIDGALCG